jgi:uncharacterized protein YgfB (UPF0149 family)
MFDELPGEVGANDFDDFANMLLEQGLEAGPSEVHGCICGLLAAGAPDEVEWGLAGLSQALDLVMHGDLAGQVMALYRASAEMLAAQEFDFYPLLPDDEVDMATRTAALAGWCSGFLAGYALPAAGGPAAGAPATSMEGEPGDDRAEVLRDFTAIAGAEVDDTADEEELEGSYTELVEYVRFAALNVYLDHRIGGHADPAGPVDGMLH